MYSALTGKVLRPLASAKAAGAELDLAASDFDAPWRYFVQSNLQSGATAATGALMRVPSAGGASQAVLAHLPQDATNYVVSADGRKVVYTRGSPTTSVVVATTGDHPVQTTIAVPASDAMVQPIGWLPDDRTVVAVLPSNDATPGKLVEFDTAAAFALKVIFAPPWPVAYSHDGCPDEELAGAVDGGTIALAVGACAAGQEPTPQLYFVDAAGNHGSPIAVTAHTPYFGGFSVYGVQFASSDEVVVLLAHQDCYGPGVRVAVTKGGTSHYVAVQGDGCGG